MAVRYLFTRDTDHFAYWHDEEGHGGIMSFDDVMFAKNRIGEREIEDRRFLLLRCFCGAVSLHPIGGGCDAEGVQRLFVEKLRRMPDMRTKTARDVVREVVDEVIKMDGPERVRLAEDGSLRSPLPHRALNTEHWGPIKNLVDDDKGEQPTAPEGGKVEEQTPAPEKDRPEERPPIPEEDSPERRPPISGNTDVGEQPPVHQEDEPSGDTQNEGGV